MVDTVSCVVESRTDVLLGHSGRRSDRSAPDTAVAASYILVGQSTALAADHPLRLMRWLFGYANG